jgi:hypothetical protein
MTTTDTHTMKTLRQVRCTYKATSKDGNGAVHSGSVDTIAVEPKNNDYVALHRSLIERRASTAMHTPVDLSDVSCTVLDEDESKCDNMSSTCARYGCSVKDVTAVAKYRCFATGVQSHGGRTGTAVDEAIEGRLATCNTSMESSEKTLRDVQRLTARRVAYHSDVPVVIDEMRCSVHELPY